MGRDKAFVHVHGRELVAVAVDALAHAGAARVAIVGGDGERFAALGYDTVTDEFPGEGPLGGLVTALRASSGDTIMVLTCDLPAVTAFEVAAIVEALASSPWAQVAAPLRNGNRQLLTACYRRDALTELERAFLAGVRAIRLGAEGLTVREVDGLDAAHLADADTPEALEGLVAGPPD